MIPLVFLIVILSSFCVVEGFMSRAPGIRYYDTSLCGRKRGKLSQNVGSIAASKSASKTTGKRIKKQSTKPSSSDIISPSLAKWAESREEIDGKETSVVESTVTTGSFSSIKEEESTSLNTVSQQKQKKTSLRRDRQVKRQKLLKERQSKLDASIEAINSLVDPNNKENKGKLNVDELLNKLQSIIQIDIGNNDNRKSLKSLFQSSPPLQYSLVWAGSDDAICHVGTGLHKVPLARLQEVFLSVGRQNDENSNTMRSRGWKLYEVIRILGPFPNVRNILQGEVTGFTNVHSSSEINLKYDTMIDGTGKVIIPGGDAKNGDEKSREVKLYVWYADEKVIICSTQMDDTFLKSAGDGNNVLLFFKESDLEGKLDTYRVS